MTNEPDVPSTDILPESPDPVAVEVPEPRTDAERQAGEVAAAGAIDQSLVELGFVNFDSGGGDNATSGAMVSAERRKNFRRDVYVAIRDRKQVLQFIGSIVSGPFHAPPE